MNVNAQYKRIVLNCESCKAALSIIETLKPAAYSSECVLLCETVLLPRADSNIH